MAARKRKKEKRGGGLLLNSVSAIIICAALVLGISVFFRISGIEVSGAVRYSSEEIIEASGLKEGSSIAFINREAIESRISEALVYIGKVTVSRKLPGTVVIEVHESGTVACVETESGIWLIDSYCRLLEQCPVSAAENYIKVTGFIVLSPKAGERLRVNDADKAKLEYLEDILTALSDADMLRDVGGIDMSTSANPQFEYLGRFRVKLGGNADTGAKLALLVSAIAELNESERGVIDLSDYSTSQKAHFSPE